MSLFVSIAVTGISVCGLLVLRHAYRTAPLMPETYDLPSPARLSRPPVEQAEDTVRPHGRTDCTPDRTATECLMAKLQREEARQRPWEGRN